MGLNERIFVNFVPLLYNIENNLDTYVAIQDLLQTTFQATAVDTKILKRRDSNPETKGRFVYSPAFADYLLTAFELSGTQELTPVKENKAINEHKEGFKESNVDTSFNETTLDSRTFTQVLQGTPALNSTPINYEILF